MREPPNLDNSDLSAALHTHFGVAVSALEFLPLGADSASAVYRVVTVTGARYFLKLRVAGGFRPASLFTPHYLHSIGVPHVLAPLRTRSGELWVSIGDAAMTLYPFLDAQTGTVAGLSERHWRQLGATLREIHGAGLPPDLERAIGSETFLPSRRSVLDHLDAAIARRDPADAVQGELATLWAARRSDIGVVIERCDALARGLRTRCLPLVLCHADLHTWNVLLDKRRRMWIVDWDETVLAPKERDLMFVVGGILAGLVSPRQTECFMRGYGEATIDEQALAYYRYAWAVQDMAAYAELVFFAAELGDVSRRHALRGFVSLFEPGGIVAIALSSRSAIA